MRKRVKLTPTVRKSSKLTPAEMAAYIIRDGEIVNISSAFIHYYDAFGQRWRIIYYETSGKVKAVEQVRRDRTTVRL